MEKQYPRLFNFVIIIAAWQTYRIVGALFWGGLDLSGGGVFPNAWVIPLSQDTLTGLLAPVVVFLLAMQPILVGLVAPRWSGETIGWKRWIGLVLGLAGAAIVIIARSEIAAPSAWGFVYAAIALLGITGGSLWEKRFGVSQHPVTTNLVGFTAGFMGVAPFMIAFEAMEIVWTWQLIVSLLYLIVASSLIAIGLLLAMIRAGEVSKVSALFFLVPPLAAFFAWVVLGEIMPPMAWVGMIVAGAGVFIATRKT